MSESSPDHAAPDRSVCGRKLSRLIVFPGVDDALADHGDELIGRECQRLFLSAVDDCDGVAIGGGEPVYVIDGGSHTRSTQLHTYSRRVLVQIARLVVPLVIVVFLGAPLILQVFGSAYAAEGAALLRWLAFGVLPNILIALFISLARVQNRSGTIMLVQGTLSLLILGLSYLWLPDAGHHRRRRRAADS